MILTYTKSRYTLPILNYFKSNVICLSFIKTYHKFNYINKKFYSLGRETLPTQLQEALYLPNVQKKLQSFVERYNDMVKTLNEEVDTMSSKKLAKMTSSISNLEAIVEGFKELKALQKEQDELNELKVKERDQSIIEMIKEELLTIQESIKEKEVTLVQSLVPQDAMDSGSAILEIRAGTGGDEAALFCGNLLNMYQRLAQSYRWKFELIQATTLENGKGYKEVLAGITGNGVFGQLKFESGVHRVQRVPETESQGRVHTSTATVAIMPEASEVEIEIKESDLKIELYRASGAGGQHVNTTDSAVRITHLPTGVVVAMQDERSQHKNKAKALKVLRARVYEIEREKIDMERRQQRNSQIGTGSRSEKIRTYNYPQNRVTDHRINYTLHNLDSVVMSGEGLKEMIEQLRFQHQLEVLSHLE